MSVPEWLRSKDITARFRVAQEDWQKVTILLNENGGTYTTPDGNEEGTLQCVANGSHPLGGEVLVLYWLEHKGPLAGQTGIDTLWLQAQSEGIKVCGTFFLDHSHDYGEIRSH